MSTRYVTIHPDGRREHLDFALPPDSGDSAVMEHLHKAVGGHLEHVRVYFDGHTRDAYINEEGKLERLPFNRKATEAWCAHYGVNPACADDVICGPMVVEVPL